MKNKNIILYSISIIFLAIFVGLLGFGIHSQNKKSLELSNKVSEIKVIEEDIAHNQRLIESLEKEYKSKLKEKATVETLFESPSSIVYKEFFPQMKNRNIKGIIALSPDNFIGGKGSITKSQFNEMIKAGWEYAVIWDGKGDFDSFMKNTKNKFDSQKIAMPPIMYFEPKTYSKKYNKTLEKYKIKTVIHHGEENLSLISGKFTKPVWFIGSASILSTRHNINISSVIKDRGNIVYTVNDGDLKIPNASKFILELIMNSKNSETKQPLLITSVKEARDIHGNLSSSDLKLSSDFRKQRKVYEDKIDKLNGEIKEIYYGNNK